jgi:hypothetical protein
MKTWSDWRSAWSGPKTAPAANGGQAYAHNDGAPTAPAGPTPGRAELGAAYEKGRKDEQRRPKRRRGSSLFSFLILMVVAAAGILFYLAAQNGSFANGGAVVDQHLAQASHTVQAPFKRAANQAGDALETAGQKLKQNAGDQPANR